MSGIEIWALVLLVAALVPFAFAFRNAWLMDRRYKENPGRRRRAQRVYQLNFVLMVVLFASFAGCTLRGMHEDDATWAKACHADGGVTTHDGCFKIGSEINLP